MSLSVLRRPLLAQICPLRSNYIKVAATIPKRWGHNLMPIKPSEFTWNKMKDLWHFYGCIAFLFYGGIAMYANIFIGPATLAEIPEGYRPKHWEYYRHPIARWLQRYCYTDPQMEYEKVLAYLYEEHIYMFMNMLDKKVQDMIKERKDYQAYYVRPVTADHHRHFEEQQEVTQRYLSTIDDGV